MVDTKRTLAALQTLLADNTTGDISPQDVRDMLVSLWGSTSGLAEGDMIAQNDSGLWVPVGGTKAEGKIPKIQADGSVAWDVDATGGGGGGGAEAVEDLAADSHSDRGSPVFVREFTDGETEDSITVEDASPNITKMKARGKLSVSHPGAGDSTAELHGIVWAHAPAGSFYIETAFRMIAISGLHSMVGIVAADGSTYGTGTQMFYSSNGGNGNVYTRHFTNWNTQGTIAGTTLTPYVGRGITYLRLAYNSSTNLWTGYISPDGNLWIAGNTHTAASPTTTHVGFAHSSWNSAVRHVVAWEYLAVYGGLP